ncbi:ABC transporter ATP-binding protein [Halobacteriales archaeon SW_8_65_20]|nr:MAG: ABC transporter ATP-binding protein [Halobacteriales archaeon SW_8_65_20]
MNPQLSTDGVTKRFGGVTAVDDVDIEVKQGEIVGLIGPNGAGKSTLFNCITGALNPNSGTVRLDGEELSELPEHAVAQQGLIRMFQHTRVYGEMTVRENALVSTAEDAGLAGSLTPPGESTRERASELLEYVGLGGLTDVKAGRLSFGQQKLLEFAMALMREPDVLLMDEPAGGINPAKLNQLIEYIRDVNSERSVTILLIEHNMEFVMEVADRIYVLAHGETIAEGSPTEIQNNERVLDAYLGRE